MSQQTMPRGEWGTGLDGKPRESGHQSGDRSHLVELLDERLRFETLLARLSATFINLPADAVDGQIERGLQQIVEFLAVDRSTLAQFTENGSDLVATHSYAVPGSPPFPRLGLATM